MSPVAVLTKLFDVDPNTAKFILGGTSLLAAAAIVLSWDVDPTDVVRLALYILGFSILVVIGSNFPGRISRMAAWLLFGIFALFLTLFTLQFLTDSHFSPPLPLAGCFISPMTKGCGIDLPPLETAAVIQPPRVNELTPRLAAAAIDTAETPHIVTSERTFFGIEHAFRGQGALVRVQQIQAITDTASTPIVYIQFSGSFTRDSIIKLAEELSLSGWDVKGKEQGGEQLSSAFGLSEVRYFHSDDEAFARSLAREITGLNTGAHEVGLRNLSNSGLKAHEGQLEVWISK